MQLSHKSGFCTTGVIFYTFFTFAAIADAWTYSGGSGTAEDPYKISTVADWQELIITTSDYDKNFILLNDIDFAGINLTPVAPDIDLSKSEFQGKTFWGIFNGDHHTLYHVTIALPPNDYVGLFGSVGYGGKVYDLSVENVEMSGRYYGGTLCGRNLGTIENCIVSGSVSSKGEGYISNFGGICGENWGNISNCHVSGNVIGDRISGCLGGLCGLNDGQIVNCYVTGNIVGKYDVIGGLVGIQRNYGSIIASYATGTVTGRSRIGGLAGHTVTNTSITGCYATGDVIGTDLVGGLVGINRGALTNSFATGRVMGTTWAIGGLVGLNTEGAIRNCYATNEVQGTFDIGGLVGYHGLEPYGSGSVAGSITACYATGPVTGEGRVGGLVGSDGQGNITACYAIGSVSGTGNEIGGLVGVGDGTTACFWDIDSSGQICSGSGRGLTPSQMKTLLIYQNAGWADRGWILDEGIDYPRLAWENTAGVSIPKAQPIPLAGTGKQADPFQISSADDLSKLSWYAGLNQYYILTKDLDLSEEILYPIGGDMGAFSGVFNGNGHVIRNITIVPNKNNASLIGILGTGGRIQDLGIEDIQITGKTNVGGLVGSMIGEEIRNCHAIGTVTGESTVGGLVGIHAGGTITDCRITCEVTGNTDVGGLAGINAKVITGCQSMGKVTGQTGIGGLVGSSSGGRIIACHSTSEVQGNGYIGGFVGHHHEGYMIDCFSTGQVIGGTNTGGLIGANGGRIEMCYAKGDVFGTNHVGGLCGYNDGVIHQTNATGEVKGTSFVGGLSGSNQNGTITQSYASGAVIGGDSVGGLCGYDYDGEISYCFASGHITGDTNVGGLCGQEEYCHIHGCFWDVQTSGQTASAGGTGKSTDEMKDPATFTSAGWDFTKIWWLPNEGYPKLLWGRGYSGGSGTAEDPYKISTVADWQELVSVFIHWARYFVLVNDIDFEGREILPIAANSDPSTLEYKGTPFTGCLDGKGHVISNVVIDLPNKDYVGLFGYLGPNSWISNLGIMNATIHGRGYVGGLAGELNEGSITSCRAEGIVAGKSYIGGLVGYNEIGSITSCSTAGIVERTGHIDDGLIRNYVGGLVGGTYGGSISSCYSNGSITGPGKYVGGLVGSNSYGSVTSCYAAGSVNGVDYAGGLAGYNLKGTILTSYATGSANGGSHVGGFVGRNDQGKILRGYSTGKPTGTSYIGGFCGSTYTAGQYEDVGNYWDTESSETKTSPMGVGKTTAEMKTRANFTDARWDFVGEAANGTGDMWRMCGDGVSYPRLSWEFSRGGDLDCPDGVSMDDLLYLAGRWMAGTPATIGAADADGDGRADLVDLGIVSENWMR